MLKRILAAAAAVTVVMSFGMVCSADAFSDEITTDEGYVISRSELNASKVSVEDMLKAAQRSDKTAIYDGTSKVGFNVNGRTYYTGAVLTSGNSVTLNTKNIKSLSFDLGHVDNSYYYSADLMIYLDGELYNTYNLKANIVLKHIELDVSNIDTVKIVQKDHIYSPKYAAVNFNADGTAAKKAPDVPNYKDLDTFMGNIYNVINVDVYDSTKKLGYPLNGRIYYNGLIMNVGSGFSFNCENMDSFEFDIAQVDNSYYEKNEIYVYLDDELFETIYAVPNMKITHKKYDLKNINNVRIVAKDGIFQTRYALGDIKFNSIKGSKSYTVPEYKDNAETFLNSAYNKNNVSVYDKTQKLGFDMNGTNYFQGVVLGESGRITFNTEKVGTISFTLGHVDGSYNYDSEIYVYFDNVLYDIKKLTPDMKPINVTYGLDGVNNVLIYEKSSIFATKYALADISISAEAPKAAKGDVNGDGKINAADITKIAAHIKGLKTLDEDQKKRADVNSDGNINAVDITKIAAHIKGLKKLS